MVRGRGGYPRGNYRGNSSWNGGGYGRTSPDRFPFGGKYGSDRYRIDDYAKPYRMGSRHDSYGGSYSGRYDPYPPERRGFSGERERHVATSSPYPPRREEFRKPPSPRGPFRGRLGSRGSRGGRRERGVLSRRRLADRYGVRKRGIRAAERRAKLLKLRSRRKNDEDGKEESDEEKTKEVKEGEEVKKEKVEGEEDAEMKEVGEGEEGEESKEGAEKKEDGEKAKEKKEKADDSKSKKNSKFVKLECPQCNVKVSTFRHYEAHLRGRTHKLSMRKVALKQRTILSQMRQAQRNAQNELEKNTSSDELSSRTQFCPLCKLNFKQSKSVHHSSQAHKNMKKYLLPYCKVCKLTFKSPMFYENHLCSIEHLKRKQRAVANGEGSAEEDNLEDFTTIDSVGEVEENAGSADEEKEEVNVGIEQIKKIDVYYCDLCRMYLRRGATDEDAEILSSHCRKRPHMQRYIRYKENEELKKRAEKLQRKETAEKEKKKEVGSKKEGDESAMDTSDAKDASKDGKTEEDKLWESVDKDLGELLEEGDGTKSDDDDDDSRVNGERYDRFKSAEKDKSGEEGKAEGAEAATKGADAAEKAETA